MWRKRKKKNEISSVNVDVWRPHTNGEGQEKVGWTRTSEEVRFKRRKNQEKSKFFMILKWGKPKKDLISDGWCRRYDEEESRSKKSAISMTSPGGGQPYIPFFWKRSGVTIAKSWIFIEIHLKGREPKKKNEIEEVVGEGGGPFLKNGPQKR